MRLKAKKDLTDFKNLSGLKPQVTSQMLKLFIYLALANSF